MGAESTVLGLPTKYVSLVILVVQNTALALTMRYSRTVPGPKYLTSTAVLISEAIKLVLSLVIHICEQYATSSPPLSLPLTADSHEHTAPVTSAKQRHSWLAQLFGLKSGFLKLLLPAVLYTLQNNLQFIAASHLDVATFQVAYQGKILTTALFAVILLRQSLSGTKWLALLLLTAGVACVQVPASTGNTSTPTTPGDGGSYLVGIISVTVACLCSGFAGVYFEKVLKTAPSSNNSATTSTTATTMTAIAPPPPSLWVRNIQLSTICLFIATTGTLIWDGPALSTGGGFFQGYHAITWIAIMTQAAGGLIVALVIKYADSILKGFATSSSIIVSALLSIPLFGFVVTRWFVVGSVLVVGATWLYSLPDKKEEGYTRVDEEELSEYEGDDEEKASHLPGSNGSSPLGLPVSLPDGDVEKKTLLDQ